MDARNDSVSELDNLAETVASVPRLSRQVLMEILEKCYAFGIRPIDETTRKRLMEKLSEERKSEGASRAYLLASKGNEYSLIVRYVFCSNKERTNASRYSNILAWLKEQGCSPENFRAEVTGNGGLSAIYWLARHRDDKPMRRNKLNLSTTIAVRAGQHFTLRLKANANGIFDVLGLEIK